MANVIKVKRGSSVPTTANLQEYELGYSTSTKHLYTRDNNTIVDLTGSNTSGGGNTGGTTNVTYNISGKTLFITFS